MKQFIKLLETELSDVANYAQDTVDNYRSCIEKFCEFINNKWAIHPFQVKGSYLKEWMKHLKQTGVSNSRLIHHKSALNHFYSLMLQMNYIDKNPALALFPIKKVNSDLNQPINSDTAYRLLNAVDQSSWLGKRDFMILSCLWTLGIRRQELVLLKVEDFNRNLDPKNKIGLLTVHGKGNKQRALFVVDKLYDNLIKYLNHHKSLKQKQQPLFPSKLGTFLNGDAIGKIVRKTTHKAGIQQRITPHVLRHSFATEMYLQNVPPQDIQTMMGHDSIEETAVYIHIPMQLKQNALQQITISGESYDC